MEGVHAFEQKIVRIGGGSQNEIVKQYNIRNLAPADESKARHRERGRLHRLKMEAAEKIRALISDMDLALSLDVLKNYGLVTAHQVASLAKRAKQAHSDDENDEEEPGQRADDEKAHEKEVKQRKEGLAEIRAKDEKWQKQKSSRRKPPKTERSLLEFWVNEAFILQARKQRAEARKVLFKFRTCATE